MSSAGEHQTGISEEEEPTLGRLVADASRDISTLIQSEIQLAKSELKVSVRAGGAGAAFLGLAGFVGLLVLVLASITIAQFIIWAGLDPWWAYLIVTGGYLLLAALLAWIGIRKFKKVRGPEKTIATARDIPKALKTN
jgi:hypothetical protein